jgi:hypothetical protein
MNLPIDNEETLKMAAELAAIRGVSVGTVVEDLLRRELAAELARRSGKTKAERIREAVLRFREGLPPGIHSSDHNELYGEDGLPR